MNPPKKKSIIIWNGIDAGDVKRADYISVDHLKEWIDENWTAAESYDDRRIVWTDDLLKFIDEP